MNTYNFNLGTAYRAVRMDPALDPVPTNPAFKSMEGEIFFFEPQSRMTYERVMYNIQQGYITPFDLKVLALIATFGSACMTNRSLKTLLVLNGEELGSQDHRLKYSLNRLSRNYLVSFGHFKAPNVPNATMFRVICLTGFGSRVAKSMGIVHRFNPLEVLDAPTAKCRSQISMVIANFIKNLPDGIDSFEVRPLLLAKEAAPDGIVRPSAKLRMFGEDVYVEVLRSGFPDHLTFLADKLRRYMLVLGEAPSLIINGEDEAMNRAIYEYLRDHGEDHGFPLSGILFTDDLAQFGPGFATCLYSFDESGNKVCFEFTSRANATA